MLVFNFTRISFEIKCQNKKRKKWTYIVLHFTFQNRILVTIGTWTPTPLFFPCTTMFRSASTHIKYRLLFYLNTPVKIVHAIEEFFCFYYLFVVRVNTYFKIAVDRKIVQYVLKIMKYFIFLVSNHNSLKITYMNFRSY